MAAEATTVTLYEPVPEIVSPSIVFFLSSNPVLMGQKIYSNLAGSSGGVRVTPGIRANPPTMRFCGEHSSHQGDTATEGDPAR